MLVHDPQHRPVQHATVVLASASSAWQQTTQTDADGVAQFLTVPIGDYRIRVDAPGFAQAVQPVTAISDRVQELHLALRIATEESRVEVSAEPEAVNPSSSTPVTDVSRRAIAVTPGADRTNSLAFITDFVPGATVVHDQLHVRGGHQVTWAIDGVPIPNTNIASNVGPQFDPKDVDFLEVQRGSYLADYGDRTYGVFNVAPRSGFERNHTAELLLSYGNFNQTDNQISFGDHTDRFAYYVSASGNRTDHGLETPTFANLHNQAAGGSAFTSLTYNGHHNDQFRFVGSMRQDFYQVPNTPEAQAAGVRDRDREQDAFASFTYLRQLNNTTVFSVTPMFHFNRADFVGLDDRASTYAGGQATLTYTAHRHNARVGLYGLGQHDSTLLALVPRESLNGSLVAGFVEDQFHATSWLTVNGGVRLTSFAGALSESAASPRVGVAVKIPHTPLVARAAYSRFYQAPPLSTVCATPTAPTGTGTCSLFAAQGFGFLPLRGERDEQQEYGLAVPVRGWTLDLAYFRTHARNYFDHDALGNSNIFFPLTIARARIRGFEATVRSPRLFKRAQFHLAYSRQVAQAGGAVTGGLTAFDEPIPGWIFLDHDQRHTLTTGFNADIPWRSWVSANFSYGSGFLNGDGPEHLPSHNSLDLAVGRSFGENWAAKVTATNITNARYFIDLSNTFGGSHVAEPRMITAQVRYTFKY